MKPDLVSLGNGLLAAVIYALLGVRGTRRERDGGGRAELLGALGCGC